MFVAKYSLPGKITSTQSNYTENGYFGVAEKSFKDKCESKRKSYLCLNEKLEFNSYKEKNLLNKRSELINK